MSDRALNVVYWVIFMTVVISGTAFVFYNYWQFQKVLQRAQDSVLLESWVQKQWEARQAEKR
jgi:hypothetical protein